jgi:hypothetical protein
MLPKLASISSCLSFPSARIIDMHHHAQFRKIYVFYIIFIIVLANGSYTHSYNLRCFNFLENYYTVDRKLKKKNSPGKTFNNINILHLQKLMSQFVLNMSLNLKISVFGI